MNIGLDLDNTIIDYSYPFLFYAKKLFPNLEINGNNNKENIKQLILCNYDQASWQKLQGIVYGKGLSYAKLFPELYRFLWRAKNNNINIYIVSHKTIYGHNDNSKINLHAKAFEFLKKKNIYNLSEKSLVTKVYFCSTKEEKIQKIKELNLNIFVDDLVSVLNDNDFPKKTRKILFSPSADNTDLEIVKSYNQLSNKLFGEWSIKDFQMKKPLKMNLLKIKPIIGQGNSKVFYAENIYREKICLKFYPIDLNHDRINSEYNGLKEISKENKNVAIPFWKNKDAQICAYKWVDGNKINKPTFQNLDFMLNFLNHLHQRRMEKKFLSFSYASSYCLSGYEIELQLNNRINQLSKINDKHLRLFLNKKLLPIKECFIRRAKNILTEKLYYKKLTMDELTLSPSDFGFHNTLKKKDGELVFLDFEYFGWDDPVKLIADFYFHPGNKLLPKQKNYWLKNSIKLYKIKNKNRLLGLIPLYGLCWTLIILNEYKGSEWLKRVSANKYKVNLKEEILNKKLNESKFLLQYTINLSKRLSKIINDT